MSSLSTSPLCRLVSTWGFLGAAAAGAAHLPEASYGWCSSLFDIALIQTYLKSMDVRETKRLPGYSKPPWIFKGSALYQLHLVKADTARAFIPKEFKLVEAFGYTLGGFFLANYDDSPAGVFDELVVIAGLVWNPPTSCAWAARVLVNSNMACDHGRKDVGLPSQVARFSKTVTAIPRKQGKIASFLNMIGMGANSHYPVKHMDLQVTEINGHTATDICNIKLATIDNKWMGPQIKMSLPSFSGCTEYNQNLLKYSCQIECRVQTVQAAKVSGACRWKSQGDEPPEDKSFSPVDTTSTDNGRDLSISVMLSKPILALQFNCLKMQVKAPVVVSQCSESSIRSS